MMEMTVGLVMTQFLTGPAAMLHIHVETEMEIVTQIKIVRLD